MPKKKTPLWISNRILHFFNQAKSVDDILDGTIEDDPENGPGKTIGLILAARILRTRNQLRRRRFTKFEELDAIKGVGKDTIQDLVYSFGTSAAESFKRGMYENNVIFLGNWPLEYFQTSFSNKKEFNNLVSDEKKFRAWVVEKIGNICQERKVTKPKCRQMQNDIKKGYIDTYHNSTPAAAYAMALWFYEFDADNWFSWERIQEQTINYFEFHMGGNPWDMELRFFKGFNQRDIIPPGITPPDLPVVINWSEQVITLWVSALYD